MKPFPTANIGFCQVVDRGFMRARMSAVSAKLRLRHRQRGRGRRSAI